MNVSRRCLDGTTHPEEQLNKSQIYINFLVKISNIVLSKNSNTTYTILRGEFYKDYSKLTNNDKQKFVSLLRNMQV